MPLTRTGRNEKQRGKGTIMKSKKNFLAAVLAILLILSIQIPAFAAEGGSQSLSPSLISSGYSVSKSSVSAGETFTLKFTLKNTSKTIDIRNVNIRLAGGEVFSVNNDSDTIYADTISKNSSNNFSKSFYCNAAESGVYPITVSATYEYFDDSEKVSASTEFNYTVKVSGGDNTQAQAQPLTPQLIVSDFSYSGDNIEAQKNFELKFNIKNTSKTTAVQNVIVKLSGGEAFVVADGTDTVVVDTISAGKTTTISKNFLCANAESSGIYPITATVTYEYYENGQRVSQSADLSMSIPVVQPDRVEFGLIDLSEKSVTVDQETDCAFTVINSGRTRVATASVKLYDEAGTLLSSAYVGNIEAGEQFSSNYTLPVTFKEIGAKQLKLVLEYDSENFERKTVETQFNVTVEEKFDPYAEALETQQDETENGGMNYTAVIIIAVVVVVIAAVAIPVAVKVSKKKKSRKGSDEFNEEI